MGDDVTLPDWTWTETLLAYDLYLRDYHETQRYADGSHPAVQQLSRELRRLPIHPATVRNDLRFRNPNGVARKVQNLMWFATGERVGSAHGSATDRKVVDTLTDFDDVKRIADAVRSAPQELPTLAVEDESDFVGEEGELLYRWHATRERDRSLVRRKKASAMAVGGQLTCEACGLDVSAVYGADAFGLIECHHKLPLARGKRTTRLEDLALVCPTCHRYLHRHQPWLLVEELAERLQGHD